MDETKQILKERLQEGKRIGADKSITVKESASQISGIIQKEFAMAADYTACRAKRKKAVAKRLQILRKERGMKQQDTADKTGINAITLSGYEIGKNEPNMEALVRLANVYEVSLDYLMCREDTESD